MNKNTSKHTPGPWRIGKLRRIESPTPGGGCVVVVSELEVSSEDARLIAAAPELLEALQSSAACLERLMDKHDDHHNPYLESLAQARAAIAKAEGKA